MFVQTSPRPEIAEVRNCAWEEFREIHRGKKKTTFPKAKQIRGCGITSLIPPPPPPSHHVLPKPREALSGWIFWGSREGKAFSVALPSPWIKQHKTSWLSRLHHPQPLPQGILPKKRQFGPNIRKQRGFTCSGEQLPGKVNPCRQPGPNPCYGQTPSLGSPSPAGHGRDRSRSLISPVLHGDVPSLLRPWEWTCASSAS